LRYSGLRAWDALGRELEARLEPALLAGPDAGRAGLGLWVDDRGASYPLTIDPLLTSPAWTFEIDQDNAWLGESVATAGDVNRDGYSDVLVGAPQYDAGQPGEGRAFLFLGSPSGPSTTPDWTAESNQDLASFGKAVAGAGDVDGDGYSDVLVGADLYDGDLVDEGGAWCYLGSAGGLSATPAWSAEGDQVDSSFGAALTCAGDVNGDGYSDVVIGAWRYDNGQNGEGRAVLYLGSPTGLRTFASWAAEANNAGAQFGVAVAGAGDVNGDGFDDLLVGAPQYVNSTTDKGRAFLYTGRVTGLSPSAAWSATIGQPGSNLGLAVGGAGDVNGDGFCDVLVGAPLYTNGEGSEGVALLYLGSSSGPVTFPSWSFEADQTAGFMGRSVAGAGDVNGDGFADVVVGSAQYTVSVAREGAALVFHGSPAGLGGAPDWVGQSGQANAWYGGSVAGAGDVDSDGFSDVIVGSRQYGNGQANEGRAWLYRGSAGGPTEAPAWFAGSAQLAALFGYSVAAAGDVNGDGFDDLLVGAYGLDVGQFDEGGAFVFLGSADGPETAASWSTQGGQVSARYGWCVSSAGDVNGDGYADVLVAADAYDAGQVDEGRVFVFHGSPSGLSTSAAWTSESDQAGARHGWSAAGVGDVNADGYADVLVGAPDYDGGQTDEGRVFLYVGSAEGLTERQIWQKEVHQAGARFGAAVAGAGDTDGDGFHDVIVGAESYDEGQVDEGKVFVFRGRPLGLFNAAVWSAQSDAIDARFGHAVSSAGDVNGDGYADVLVGAYRYTNGQAEEGRAWLYLGSSAGPSAGAAWSVEGGQVGAQYGWSVAAAGDVDSDGYGDVIVGAQLYDEAFTDEGRAYLYRGSASGLAVQPAWTVDGEQDGAFLGISVCGAGDVNGDGFADVAVGAWGFDDLQVDEGRALVFLGNGGSGWLRAPQQRASSNGSPVELFAASDVPDAFRIRARFPRGLQTFAWITPKPTRLRLEWEVKPQGTAFDGLGLARSALPTTLAGGPVVLNELATVPGPGAYKWRARILTNNPLMPTTPWFWPMRSSLTEHKLRTFDLPVPGSGLGNAGPIGRQ
jgi:hypothetical protein